MKNFNLKNITVIDNNGDTFDRYTIIDKRNGDMIGSSDNPFSPLGFGQYCGNLVDNYMYLSYGYAWRKYCNVKKITKHEVSRFLSDCSHLGKVIDFNTLPTDVQKFTVQSFTDNK
jgi:hypothetical protein